jgi:acyl-CoA synthetase (AMP-forming)/AMP-acid ligase II
MNPFPSQPIGFYADPSGARFHAAYFTAHPGIWTRGDMVEITPSVGARLLGRTDGVLNARGINVGPAEICSVLNDIPGIREALRFVKDDFPSEVDIQIFKGNRQHMGILQGPETRYVRRQVHTRTKRTIIPKMCQQFDTLGHAAFTHRPDRLCFAAA